MKETTNFDDFSVKKAISLAKTFAKDAYTKELGVVLSVAFRDIRNLPALKFNQNEPIPLKEYVKKWVARYLSGYNGRPSKRQGKKSQTKTDPAEKSWKKLQKKPAPCRKINSPNPKRRYRRQFRRYT